MEFKSQEEGRTSSTEKTTKFDLQGVKKNLQWDYGLLCRSCSSKRSLVLNDCSVKIKTGLIAQEPLAC